MNRGGTENWAYATLGVLLLNLYGRLAVLTISHAPVMAGIGAQISSGVEGAVVCAVGSGFLSAVQKRWTPVAGALSGIALYVAVMAVTALAGTVIANTSGTYVPKAVATGAVWVMISILTILPVAALLAAFLRKPRQ